MSDSLMVFSDSLVSEGLDVLSESYREPPEEDGDLDGSNLSAASCNVLSLSVPRKRAGSCSNR